MSRIANDEHRFIRIEKGDTVIFSSSVIPGNEGTVQRLQDVLYRKRAKVIHKDMMDVHAGGHAKKEDVKLMLSLFRPKFYMPIEGNHFLLRENAEVAYSMGWKEEDVYVADNGQILEFSKDAKGQSVGQLMADKVPSDYVFVDGLGVGDVSQVILRDRQALAEDGMVVVIVQVKKETGRLNSAPDIVTRGFIHIKENIELMTAMHTTIEKALAAIDPLQSMADPAMIKDAIREEVGKILFQKTERRPMILPVLIEV